MWPFHKRTCPKCNIRKDQAEHLLRIGQALADSPKCESGFRGYFALYQWQEYAVLALSCRDVSWFATWRLNQYARRYAMDTETQEGEVLVILPYPVEQVQ